MLLYLYATWRGVGRSSYERNDYSANNKTGTVRHTLRLRLLLLRRWALLLVPLVGGRLLLLFGDTVAVLPDRATFVGHKVPKFGSRDRSPVVLIIASSTRVVEQ